MVLAAWLGGGEVRLVENIQIDRYRGYGVGTELAESWVFHCPVPTNCAEVRFAMMSLPECFRMGEVRTWES